MLPVLALSISQAMRFLELPGKRQGEMATWPLWELGRLATCIPMFCWNIAATSAAAASLTWFAWSSKRGVHSGWKIGLGDLLGCCPFCRRSCQAISFLEFSCGKQGKMLPVFSREFFQGMRLLVFFL